MMRRMRASAKWIMGILAVAFVGWLVFDVGMDVGGRGSSTISDVVGRVNGRDIVYQTFYGTVRNAQEQQRQLGNPINTLDQIRELEDQVFESMVQQIALEGEYARRSIRLSDRELADAIRNQPLPEFIDEPTFQTDGQFDLNKYQRYIESADIAFQLSLEARYRQELPQLKLYNQLISDVFVTDGQLWRMYQDEIDSVTVRLITLLPQAAIDDEDVEVSDEGVAAYFDEHRADYERPATAHLSYVTVPRIPNSADTAAARERASDVLAELRDGADFAELAARESADSTSREDGGDLGEANRGQHVSAFTDAALALQPGEISEPVLTDFGYHIIQLHSKSGDTYHASHILIPVELEGEHLTQVESRGDSLDLYAAEQDDPAALDSIAASMGLTVGSARPLAEGGRVRIGVDFVPDVGVWAFEALEGEISHVIETDRAFYVFRLDRLEPQGVPSLDEVRARVSSDAMLAAKWAKTEELADSINRDIEAGKSYDEVAATHDVRSTELPPFTRLMPNSALYDAPAAIGAAFGLELGRSSGPVRTDQAIFFVQPIARQLADSSAFAAGIVAYRERVLEGMRRMRIQLTLASIRESAEVADLRLEVAQALRSVPQGLPGGGPLGF
ncbi:MAG: peptidylprolyl isomerase [Gemmatimonadota bacterium]|nr:MAG: peptidylprolyl isomerase [Gemmatimonadota bacterium]